MEMTDPRTTGSRLDGNTRPLQHKILLSGPCQQEATTQFVLHACTLNVLLAQSVKVQGTHHFFSRAWLEKAKDHKYPWTAPPAFTAKFANESKVEFSDSAQKTWSLAETDIAILPSCCLLLVNGTHNGLIPMEVSMLMMECEIPKEARFLTW